jgi:hypothetical protein
MERTSELDLPLRAGRTAYLEDFELSEPAAVEEQDDPEFDGSDYEAAVQEMLNVSRLAWRLCDE